MIKTTLLKLSLILGMIGMFFLGQEAGYSAHKIEMLRIMQACANDVRMPPGDYEDEVFANVVYSLMLLDCYENKLLKRGKQ